MVVALAQQGRGAGWGLAGGFGLAATLGLMIYSLLIAF
jgi:hypothetical protein